RVLPLDIVGVEELAELAGIMAHVVELLRRLLQARHELRIGRASLVGGEFKLLEALDRYRRLVGVLRDIEEILVDSVEQLNDAGGGAADQAAAEQRLKPAGADARTALRYGLVEALEGLAQLADAPGGVFGHVLDTVAERHEGALQLAHVVLQLAELRLH